MTSDEEFLNEAINKQRLLVLPKTCQLLEVEENELPTVEFKRAGKQIKYLLSEFCIRAEVHEVWSQHEIIKALLKEEKKQWLRAGAQKSWWSSRGWVKDQEERVKTKHTLYKNTVALIWLPKDKPKVIKQALSSVTTKGNILSAVG
jgi:hypothetical protein